jgi:glycosyltransferase involved in cell wall biosynthesis
MAHILFITPYYPPEKGAAAVRISETAIRLVKLRHQVTVLTTVPNYPTGIVPSEYRGRVIQQEALDGVRVIRIWSYVSTSKRFLYRILAQLSFGCLAALLGWKTVGRPDVIILESHPLFNAISGRLLAWWKHCPFIFMVSDLWPESAIQLGVLRNPLLIWLSKWLEWSTYKRSSLVWALSEGIRNAIIEGGLPTDQVFLLTNGADLSKFRPLSKSQARIELGWEDRFTILYAGTFGLSHGLATVLEAAERLKDRDNIRFVFVGDGAEKTDLIAQAERLNLWNVNFFDSQPHDRMPIFLAGADVCLVPMRKLPLFEGRLPLKVFEVMACARPILLGVEGEARRLAEQNAGAAIYVEPENAEALTSGILYLQENPEEAELLGQRGRAFVEVHFNRDQLTAVLEARIEMILNKEKACMLSTPETFSSDHIPTIPVSVSAASEKSQSSTRSLR